MGVLLNSMVGNTDDYLKMTTELSRRRSGWTTLKVQSYNFIKKHSSSNVNSRHP